MKKILLLAVAIAGMWVSTAVAQMTPTAITLSTNRVAPVTTNTTAGTGFFVGGRSTVTVALSCYATNKVAADATGAGTFTITFDGSMDGTTYYKNGTNWDVVLNITATNATGVLKSLDTSLVQYLRLSKMANTSTNANLLGPEAVWFYK